MYVELDILKPLEYLLIITILFRFLHFCFKEITNDIKPSNSSYKGRLDELYALNGINKTTTANDIA